MEIRPLRPDDFDALMDAATRAFGEPPAHGADIRRRHAEAAIAAGRHLGGFDGGRLVATAKVHDLAQWWHGRPVSMGGVAGVTVAPEDRGRGAGRRIMTDILRLCAELGHPVSVLYPATTPLYRSLGWEHAGAQHIVTLPTEALRTLAADPVPIRRAGPEDAEEVAATLRRVHRDARDDGPLDRGADWWRIRLADTRLYAYLAEDGFLAYGWADDDAALSVDKVVAGSERTLRALWGVVGSGSSTAGTVHACVGPDDPVLWLVRERSTERVRRERWMLRVVDAPAAIAARGYPAAVTAEVALRVDDPVLPANSGTWRLTVKDGEGVLEPAAGDPAAVRTGIRGLSALYAGVPPAALRRAGLVECGDADADALSAVFAATPFTLDYF
ncbi:GNAT family N-acetyltransferase [Actinomadura miaoliensis]|uniref:GNAT family N-acetyltransferase n=1 Tax=Actinomadura miaoliensis TaxID=430685 RepID=A0ABP7X125_9ACTN